jgi:hypothetical protein
MVGVSECETVKHYDRLARYLSPSRAKERKKGYRRMTNLTVLDTIHGSAAVRGVIGHC